VEIREKWRDSLQKAIAPILLTVLGTFAYQSALSYYHAESERETGFRQLEDENDQLRVSAREWDRARTMLEKWVKRRQDRERKMNDVMKSGLPLMAKMEIDTQKKAQNALSEINEELGELQGFTDTNGSKSFASLLMAAELGSLQAELRTWEVVRRYTYPARDKKNDRNALYELSTANLDRLRAASYSVGQSSAQKLAIDTFQDTFGRLANDFKIKLKNIRNRQIAAAFGLGLSLGAYFLILILLMPPKQEHGSQNSYRRFE
jgi:hypothetical protein